jgi:hypothetical protein
MGCNASDLGEYAHDADEPQQLVQVDKASAEVLGAEQLLLEAWGGNWTTTGYTDGHHCIQETDTSKAEQAGASLLYGEVLPAGTLTNIEE